MKKNILDLQDINLSVFMCNLEQNEIFLEILNMENGDVIYQITMKNIMSLNYSNIEGDDILPAYIGDFKILKDQMMSHFYLRNAWLD